MPKDHIIRLRKALALRLEQGYTRDQIARAGNIDDPADIDRLVERDSLDGVSAIELDQLMRGLFVDDGYVFTGTPHVQYSPCSLRRLLDGLYITNPDTDPSAQGGNRS